MSSSCRLTGRVAAALVAAGLLCTVNVASAGELTADQIVDKMLDQEPMNYGGAEVQMLMALVDKRGDERKRKLTMYSRKDGEVSRMFIRFSSPADISGTAFLGIDEDGDRTQHLYLPALAKVRRISTAQRNGSFVGTDFSYADMDLRDVDDSVKKLVGQTVVGGNECYLVEVVPTAKKSEYTRVEVAISKKTWLPLRLRFYDKRGAERKRLTVKEVRKEGSRWIITESKMVDLKRNHTTVLKVISIKLRDDVPMEQFSVRALERS